MNGPGQMVRVLTIIPASEYRTPSAPGILLCGGFERRGVKAGPQATAIAARSGLYAS
jgi:hypothetical protein